MSHIRTLTVTPGPSVVRKALTHTSVARYDNAGLYHVFNRSQRPIYEFEITLEPLTRSEVESFQAFHFYHQGGKKFYWDGHPYNRIENYQTVAEGDGGQREFFLFNRNIDASSFSLRTLRPSTQATSVWATNTYSLNAVPGIVTLNNSTNTIPVSGDDIQIISAHRYTLLFHPEELQVEEFARGLYRAQLRMIETLL